MTDVYTIWALAFVIGLGILGLGSLGTLYVWYLYDKHKMKKQKEFDEYRKKIDELYNGNVSMKDFPWN